jgi:hypothetical protein
MKDGGRIYFAFALMLVLPGCTQKIASALPLEESYALALPNGDLRPENWVFEKLISASMTPM